MRKTIRSILAIAASAILLYGGVNLISYILETQQSATLNHDLAQLAVAVRKTSPEPTETNPSTEPPAETEPEEIYLDEEAPITVDFDVLLEHSADIVGWLYCEDTPINLPVVQGQDNEYYLNRMYDGTGNGSGTLFIDYRSPRDFTGSNTVIYGHNMKNRSMFGTLANYKRQEYYEEHPVLWLLTPERNYKVKLLAGIVTPDDADVYAYDLTDLEAYYMVRKAISDSTFESSAIPQKSDRYLTLSTCSYEFSNARYVVIGRLLPLKGQE